MQDLDAQIADNSWVDSGSAEVPDTAEPAPPARTMPPASGFWRRVAAFLVDGLILGVFLQIIALPFSSLWFGLGPYGRIAGFFIALGYFGALDSRVQGGQTPGKRLMKIAVRGADGLPVGGGVSAARTLIWLVPFILNGWALPVMSNPVVSWVAGFIIFGIGGAVVVTLVFNRRSRQGIHDLLTRTYVVHLNGTPVESLPRAGRLPWVLSGGVLALTLVASLLIGVLVEGGRFDEMLAVQEELLEDGRFFSTSIMDRTYFEGGGETSHALVVTVWYKGDPTEAECRSVVDDVARSALKMDGVEKFETVAVGITSAYDLGLASYHKTYGTEDSVDNWRERLRQD